MAKRDPAYYQKYRATVAPRRERLARQEGIQEGIERCIGLMKSLYGHRVLTGEEAAHAITKALSTAKT